MDLTQPTLQGTMKTGVMTQATGSIEAKSWNETPYDQMGDGGRLARGQVINSFRGDIEGEGTGEYLMAYQDEGSASVVGFERVTGRIGGRSGSFVLQHSGSFDLTQGKAKVNWMVAPGSGTGELRSLRGEGGYEWDRQRDGQFTPFRLDYSFEQGEQI